MNYITKFFVLCIIASKAMFILRDLKIKLQQKVVM